MMYPPEGLESRKRSRRKDPYSREKLHKWSFASDLLDLHERMAARASAPDTTIPELWTILGAIDQVPAVLGRLDRAEIERTPKGLWGKLFAQYTAACITAMARKAGVLRPLERSGLVIFPFAGSVNPLGNLRPGKQGAGGNEESDDLPALVPVSRDIPFFSADFLGLFQNRLDWLLANKRLFGRPEKEGSGMTDATRERIRPARLYNETRTAVAQYLLLCHAGRDRARMEGLAAAGAPFVFLWLARLKLLDDLIDGLIDGAPVMDKPEDPKDVFGFQRAGKGPGAGLPETGTDRE